MVTAIGFEGGPTAAVEIPRDAVCMFHVNVYGEHDFPQAQITDAEGFYAKGQNGAGHG